MYIFAHIQFYLIFLQIFDLIEKCIFFASFWICCCNLNSNYCKKIISSMFSFNWGIVVAPMIVDVTPGTCWHHANASCEGVIPAFSAIFIYSDVETVVTSLMDMFFLSKCWGRENVMLCSWHNIIAIPITCPVYSA